MKQFVTVARLNDLPPDSCMSVEAAGQWIALCRAGGQVYALDNTCPHAGGPIGEGTVVGECVECPWHGWRFNMKSGKRPENPDFKIARYDVQIDGEDIQVALPLTQ